MDDRTESYYQLLINITLSEDLTNDKKLVKKNRKILHFMILFKISVFVAMVNIFKVVAESFKMEFQVWLVYLTVRLHDRSQFEEIHGLLNQSRTFEERVIFLIIID